MGKKVIKKNSARSELDNFMLNYDFQTEKISFIDLKRVVDI